MSRIYDRLKTLETQIEQEKIGGGQLQHEREQTAQHAEQEESILWERPPGRDKACRGQEAAHTNTPHWDENWNGAAAHAGRNGNAESGAAIASFPPQESRSRAKYYLAAAALAMIAGLAAFISSHSSGEKPITPPMVQTPQLSAAAEDARGITPPHDKPARPAHNEMARPEVAPVRITREDAPAQGDRDTTANTIPHPPKQKPDMVSHGAREPESSGDANNWESRSAIIVEQLRTGAYAEVGKNAQALAEDFPERWEPWFWLGTAQLALGQQDAAENALERASKLNPKDARIWVQRAIVAQERGEHAEAIRLLGEARERSPKSPQIFLNLGYSNDALGQSAEADNNYRRFLALTEGNNAYSSQRKSLVERLGAQRR
jgi:tetratricopeptide (TPR) repeat protein